tara:strand:- start:314 stop:553 length:240 start_codon:yes stop_codon:yes gene_type:complete
MKWFLPSFWLSLLMGRRSTLVETPPSETSTDAPFLPEKSKKQATSTPKQTNTIAEAKSKRIASQGSSKKKRGSGTKGKK